MLRRVGRLSLVVVSLGVVAGCLAVTAHADQPVSDWFAAQAPVLQKMQDLPPSVVPDARNIDCEPVSYRGQGSASPIQDCVGSTSLGTISANGNGLFGNGGAPVPLLYKGGNSMAFRPRPNSTDVMALYTATGTRWQNIGFYHNLSRADFSARVVVFTQFYSQRQLWTSVSPVYLPDGNGKRLLINSQAMAFSANGRWLVADSSLGMIRVDLDSTTPAITIFAPMLELPTFDGLASAQLAITDDGQYAAVSFITGNGFSSPPNLTLYDISGCTGGANYAGCRAKDVWGAAGASATAGLGRASNVRFIDNGELSFNDMYSHSGQTFQAGVFTLAPSGTALHGMGLLGMGDSYISGEGEFTYIKDTDSSGNHCHQSALSYPFLLGAAHFGTYDSVACSGAKMVDIDTKDRNYSGQVGHTGSGNELQLFEPGYLPQDKFVSTYKPEAVVLSIGGNDIGFGDIVAQCVGGFVPDNPFDLTAETTCYPSYEDRYELAQSVGARFDDLVSTYQDIKAQAPGTRIYVAGYPHIAEPGGACGLNVFLNSYEVQFSTDLIDYLDGVIAQAAAKAGVFYVDTRHALDGHKLCESGDKAVNGLTLGDDQFGLLGHESYHPTVLGHQLLAAAIDAATNGLQAPMPMPQPDAAAPAIADTLPLLANAPAGKTGRTLYAVTGTDAATDSFWERGKHALLNLRGLVSHFASGSAVQAVIHSDPEDLGTFTTDANGDISADLAVPGDLPSGYHVLHLYGTDLAGNKVDVRQTVYVMATADDKDGDSIANGQDSCPLVPNSGTDADQDGVDDACDAVIGNPPATMPADPAAGGPTGPTLPGSQTGTARTLGDITSGTQQLTVTTADAVSMPEAQGVSSSSLLGMPADPTRQPAAAAPAVLGDVVDSAAGQRVPAPHRSYAVCLVAIGMAAGVAAGLSAWWLMHRHRR